MSINNQHIIYDERIISRKDFVCLVSLFAFIFAVNTNLHIH